MTSKRKIAYISGAISSDPHYAAKFADAETVLLSCGFDVLNPTCVPALLSYSRHMQIDKIFVSACDVIVLLPDWKISDGAKEELELGRRLKKEVILYKNILTYAHDCGMI
ncbi:MAG: DUF4406 domain-containing protein [Clostridia bacterium]|nr:DUF4406 domain-containing protein [Clostridia bacterium]